MPAAKQQSVYKVLLSELASGRYRFGQPLMVREIAERTGASKQPIMAALKELEADGFVTITAQVGCRVVLPTVPEIADFFVMFSRMEGVMAEFAAARRSAAELDNLNVINRSIAKLPRRDAGSGERYRILNREFHTAIHLMGRSPALHQQLVSRWALSDFFISQSDQFNRRLREAADEHALVIDAIAAGDTAAARSAMEAHILSFRLKITERLGSA